MRASAAAAILIAPALAIAVAPHTWASSACQSAFEKWALLSSAQVRPQQDDGGRGACVASESTRRSLLDALARARDLCGDSSDPSLQQTRTLLYINHSFISSLGVCQSASADPGAGWVTRAAPVPDRPKVAAPLPVPPAPAAPPPAAAPPPRPAPITGGPRPAAIAPAPATPAAAAPVTPPKVEVATPAPTPPCLEVSSGQGGYALVNRRCRGHTVIAVIETRTASGEMSCKGYAIGASLTMRAPTAPRINYECVASRSTCNKSRLGDMFPECDW
jgi:hypothetical protein